MRRIRFITAAFEALSARRRRARIEEALTVALTDEDRAAGEDAIGNIEGELAEATPTGMPRLKTDRL